MHETDLQRKIATRMRERGAWAEKTHGGPFKRGMPDIIATYRGYFIGLEVKLPGKEATLTKIQDATLRGIKTAGGIAQVVTSHQQALRILDSIDRAKARRGK